MIISFRGKLSQISQNSQENTISNVGNCDDGLRKNSKSNETKIFAQKVVDFLPRFRVQKLASSKTTDFT